MRTKKISIWLLFVIIVLSSCQNKLDHIYKTFGTDLNKNRVALHLVTVDPNSFKVVEDPSEENRRFIFVDHTESKLTSPAFLRKVILLDSSLQNITFEEDYFKNPIERKYLVIRHDYTSNTTEIYLESFMDLYSTTESKWIDTKQADSVLKSWNIGHNPF